MRKLIVMLVSLMLIFTVCMAPTAQSKAEVGSDQGVPCMMADSYVMPQINTVTVDYGLQFTRQVEYGYAIVSYNEGYVKANDVGHEFVAISILNKQTAKTKVIFRDSHYDPGWC